jgi:hypothetical protein
MHACQVENGIMPGLYEKTLRWLERQTEQPGGKKRVALLVKAKQATFYKVLQGKQTNAEDYLAWLERLGAKVIFPDETADLSREVKLINILNNGEGQHLPVPSSEKFRAIPLVASEVAAGPGLVPDDRIISWVVIDTTEPLVQRRANLLAVRVAKKQRSMLPLIQPGDILFVDRLDKEVRHEGNMFLVRDPDEGEAVKKVKVFTRRGRDMVTFYSLNAEEFPPDTYSLEDDFHGNLEEVIIGRVIGLWADLTKR